MPSWSKKTFLTFSICCVVKPLRYKKVSTQIGQTIKIIVIFYGTYTCAITSLKKVFLHIHLGYSFLMLSCFSYHLSQGRGFRPLLYLLQSLSLSRLTVSTQPSVRFEIVWTRKYNDQIYLTKLCISSYLCYKIWVFFTICAWISEP